MAAMEEETLFKNPNANPSNEGHHPQNPINYAPQGNLPNEHVQKEIIPSADSPIKPAPQPTYEPLLSQTPPPDNKNFLSSVPTSKIIKILLGAAAIILIFFVFLHFILPFFGKSQKNEKVNLVYWGVWEDQRIMQPVISTFETDNPNIKIEYVRKDIKDYRERLQTRINNDNGPDIFRFHNTWYPMFSKVLLPIPNNVVDKTSFEKKYYPVVQNDLIKNGAVYGIPLEIDTLALYINKDLLDAAGVQPPVTWQDLRASARSLTVKDTDGKIQTAGVAAGTFTNVSHAPDIISLLFAQNGVDLKDISKTDQRVVDALRFYTSFATGDDRVWDSSLDPSLTAFSKGALAMFFGYSWDYFNIKALNPNLSFQIVPVPQLSKDNSVNLASYWAEGVSVKSTHQKEAFLFMKYLSSMEAQEKLYAEETKTRLFGEPYSNKELSQKLLGDTNISPFLSQAPSAVSSYFVDSTQDNGLNDQLNKYLENAVNAILDNSSAESAAQTLEQGFTQVLNQYESN